MNRHAWMQPHAQFVLNIQEPWASHITSGTKVVEGRLATPTYAGITSGHILSINNGAHFVRVQSVQKYHSFEAMLLGEGLARVLPGVSSVAAGVQVLVFWPIVEIVQSFLCIAVSLLW